LTLRTGAAYTREQLIGMRNTYFPRLGDPQETVNAKQARLETLLDSAFIAAGRATPKRESSPPADASSRKNNFANQAEADQAIKDGKLKKGDKVTINGVTGTIQ
jgi:hypothetical protein